jgi:hypothetical protein
MHMVYVIPGYIEGAPRTENNRRLFLYPADDVEAYCMEADAVLGSSHERHACMKEDLVTEELKEGDACVIMVRGLVNGEIIDENALYETVKNILGRRRDILPKEFWRPRYEFLYRDEVPANVLREINVFDYAKEA